MKHVSFLGAGSWGTALAILCANNGHQVTIWSKVKAETDMLKEHREHLERLPGVKLPDSIVIEEDLEKACTNQDVIVWSVASPFVRSTAQEAKPFIKDNQIIVNVGKGIEENTLMTLCGILEDELPMADVCVLPDQAMRKKFPMEYQQRLLSEQRRKRRQCLYRMCL